jgi:alkaline phosphatase D
MPHRVSVRFLATQLILTAGFAVAQNAKITHGPMLGHVSADSISIWARTSRPGQFQIQYGRTADRLDHRSGFATTTADRDNTGWVRLTGLESNTRYYYRPITADDAGPEGSFRTLPSPDSYRDQVTNPRGLFNFRFQFGSCADQRLGQWYRS